VDSVKEMWIFGVIAICILYIVSLITPFILDGNYTINFFGIESYRSGTETGAKIGWDAIVGFLLVLPMISAGVSYFRARK
jgi:hypothetical protein